MQGAQASLFCVPGVAEAEHVYPRLRVVLPRAPPLRIPPVPPLPQAPAVAVSEAASETTRAPPVRRVFLQQERARKVPIVAYEQARWDTFRPVPP